MITRMAAGGAAGRASVLLGQGQPVSVELQQRADRVSKPWQITSQVMKLSSAEYITLQLTQARSSSQRRLSSRARTQRLPAMPARHAMNLWS
jgi:hypothetical protein